MQYERNECEVSKDISAEDWISELKEKYHNLVQKRDWQKVDHKDQNIAALTTKIKLLEFGKGGTHGYCIGGLPSSTNFDGGGGNSTPEARRTIKKGYVLVEDGDTS